MGSIRSSRGVATVRRERTEPAAAAADRRETAGNDHEDDKIRIRPLTKIAKSLSVKDAGQVNENIVRCGDDGEQIS